MKDYALLNANGEHDFIGPMDIQYDQSGRVITNSGIKMIDQLLVKDLMTQFGNSKVNPLFGGAFASMIGAKLDQVLSGAFIISEVQRVVNRVANFLFKNPNTQPDEQIKSINDVLVQTTSDPRKVQIVILMSTNSGSQTQLMVPVTVF